MDVGKTDNIFPEDIDAVLVHGSGMYEGKYRIYEQYLKKESSQSNETFLKNEYGVGGCYPAVWDRGLDESHDSKGIEITKGPIGKPVAKMLVSWNSIEKRIGELISEGLYFCRKEMEFYPKYHAKEEAKRARYAIADEFRSIAEGYNDYLFKKGEKDKVLNIYYLSGCWNAFGFGDKKMYCRTSEGDFIIPMMCEAMETIAAGDTPFTDRSKAMLETLKGDIAKALESTEEDLHAVEEIRKEYQCSIGDTVIIDGEEYGVLSIDAEKAVLYEERFPLSNVTFVLSELFEKLRKTPRNDWLLRLCAGELR